MPYDAYLAKVEEIQNLKQSRAGMLNGYLEHPKTPKQVRVV